MARPSKHDGVVYRRNDSKARDNRRCISSARANSSLLINGRFFLGKLLQGAD